MTGTLWLRNHQRTCPVDLRLLRRITRFVLQEHFRPLEFELGLHLVAAPEMTRVNEQYLQHAGSTDVITFDYGEGKGSQVLAGDIFICLDEAKIQARRYTTSWQSELVRYVIHGLLHLQGYDDLKAAPRRTMKKEEKRILQAVCNEFPVASLRKKAGRG